MLVSAGAFYGLASVVQWAAMVRLLPLSQSMVAGSWLLATVLFMICLFFLKRRLARTASAQTPGSRAVGLAWAGVGWSIFALFAAVAIVCWRTHSGIPTLLLPSIILALYGAAWTVATAVSGLKWTRLAAAGSYAMALVTAWMSVDPSVMLVYAAALVLLAVIPGIVLMRQPASAA